MYLYFHFHLPLKNLIVIHRNKTFSHFFLNQNQVTVFLTFLYFSFQLKKNKKQMAFWVHGLIRYMHMLDSNLNTHIPNKNLYKR